jgi:hypothetical protein
MVSKTLHYNDIFIIHLTLELLIKAIPIIYTLKNSKQVLSSNFFSQSI